MRVALTEILLGGWIIIALSAPGAATPQKKNTTGRFADCHIHLVDFLQQGEFYNGDDFVDASKIGRDGRDRFPALPVGDRWRRISHLLRCMDEANVDCAMICGMPVLKKWSEIDTYKRPDGYLDNESHLVLASDTDRIIAEALLDYRSKHADSSNQLAKLKRIRPFLCGIDPTDLGAVDLAVDRVKEFPGIWEGIGEIMIRHDDLTHLTLGDRPRANHPALYRLCHFAGAHYLPVSIHHNIAPVSSQGGNRAPAYLDELVELFDHCGGDKNEPATVFIWCHAGASRRVHVDNLPFWIDEVLGKFGNHVYIDLSWLVLDEYMLKEPKAWVRLVEKHPNNFMIGSDFVGGASGIGQKLAKYRPFLDRLEKKTAKRIARDNFVELMKGLEKQRREKGFTKRSMNGLALSTDYAYPEYKHLERESDQKSFVRSRLSDD